MRRLYTCWILVEPADDLPGVWIATCLNFDVVSQGGSPRQAVDAVCEAVMMALQDDLEQHLDPLDRGPAPPTDWDRLLRVLEQGRQHAVTDVVEAQRGIVATTVTVVTEQGELGVAVRRMAVTEPTFELPGP